jgi:glutathione S-transferase
MKLVIANKNYSSWSMRPWTAMRGLGIPFEEQRLSFTLGIQSGFRDAVRAISPAGRVPVLVDGDLVVWDSLAIVEYLHERFPKAGVWPSDMAARARARSICAEMHSGFSALRQHCGMNIEARLPEIGAKVLRTEPAVAKDLARIDTLWSDALRASHGPFLFGQFSAADAYYAPVATRIRTYALPMSPTSLAYVDRLLASPGPAAWIADALTEAEFVPEDEPYRTKRS